VKFLLSILLLLAVYVDPKERFSYADRPILKWSDFVGIPVKNAPYLASVNSGMGYEFSSSSSNGELKVTVKVQSYFYPQLSWKKNSNENSAILLKHEQLHWDITELHARKLRAAYSRYVPQKDPKKEVAFIFKKFEDDRVKTQHAYDQETRHGAVKQAQATWENKIREELFKMSEFAF
jgi:hypothetical protein